MPEDQISIMESNNSERKQKSNESTPKEFIYRTSPLMLETFLDLYSSQEQTTDSISIDVIKKILRICIHSLARDINIVNMLPDNGFSQDEMEDITNEALCFYLLHWLKNAENTRQNISDFAKQPFTLNNDESSNGKGNRSYGAPEESIRKQISRDLGEYNLSLQQPFIKENKQAKTKYDFVALTWTRFYQNGGIGLYRDLIKLDNPLELVRKRRNIMIDGYNDYFLSFSDMENEKDKKPMVIKALFLYEFEMAYRFLLSYQITTATDICSDERINQILDQLDVYYRPIDPQSYVHEWRDWYFASIRYNSELIKMACDNKITDAIKNKILCFRYLVQGAIYTIMMLKPEWLQRSWSEKDFDDAAEFLLKEYNIKNLISLIDREYIKNDHKCQKENNLREVYFKIIDKELLSSFKARYAGK